jgi:hypothetical protein
MAVVMIVIISSCCRYWRHFPHEKKAVSVVDSKTPRSALSIHFRNKGCRVETEDNATTLQTCIISVNSYLNVLNCCSQLPWNQHFIPLHSAIHWCQSFRFQSDDSAVYQLISLVWQSLNISFLSTESACCLKTAPYLLLI